MVTVKVFDPKTKTESVVIIRKFYDGTFYASNSEGVLLKNNFKTVEEAIIWGYRVMPNVFEE